MAKMQSSILPPEAMQKKDSEHGEPSNGVELGHGGADQITPARRFSLFLTTLQHWIGCDYRALAPSHE
jgi:hypothetical protein